jgi:hypothetical protein
LSTGVAAFICCYLFKARLGRFDPYGLKRKFNTNQNDCYLSTDGTQEAQMKLDMVTEAIPYDYDNKSEIIFRDLKQVRQVVQFADMDSHFNRNSKFGMYAGTLLMAVSLSVYTSYQREKEQDDIYQILIS